MTAPPGADDRPAYVLFTDGACRGNPGPGGWAFILRDLGSGGEVTASGGEPRTTNNRMELRSIIEGLCVLTEPSRVRIVSDSEYAVKGLRDWIEGWKKRGWRRADRAPVLNRELWEELDRLRTIHELTPQWIRGHTGHPENEACDRMAVEAIHQIAGR